MSFTQQNLPLFFYALITADRKLVLVKTGPRWTFPSLVGFGDKPHDIYLQRHLSDNVERLTLRDKEVLHLEPDFQSQGLSYDFHLIGFSAEVIVKLDRQGHIWLAAPSDLINDSAHEEVHRLIQIDRLQNRLR